MNKKSPMRRIKPMKKLIKILAIGMALLLLAGMTGCAEKEDPIGTVKEGTDLFSSNQKDPKEAYEEAVKRMEELDALSYTLDIDLEHKDADSETEYIGMFYEMKTEQTEGKLSKMVMEGTITAPGTQGYTLRAYMLDEYFYIDVAGLKGKFKTTNLEDLTGIVEVPQQQNFTSDVFKNIHSKTKDGATEISFTADGAKIMEQMESALGEYSVTTGADGSYEGITFDDAEGTVTIAKNGYLSDLNLSLPMTMEQESVVITYHIVYQNPGEKVTFEFPNFNGYYDYSEYITGEN